MVFGFFPRPVIFCFRYNNEKPRLADPNSMATVQFQQHREIDETS